LQRVIFRREDHLVQCVARQWIRQAISEPRPSAFHHDSSTDLLFLPGDKLVSRSRDFSRRRGGGGKDWGGTEGHDFSSRRDRVTDYMPH